MTGKIRWEVMALGVLTVAAPRLARAEAPGSGLTTVDLQTQARARSPEPAEPAEPAEPPSASKPPAAPTKERAASSGSSHVFDAYRVYSESVFEQRMAGGIASIVVGGTLVGLGFVTREKWNEDFGTVIVVMGGLTAVGGIVTLVLPTETESVAKANGVYLTREPSPEQEAALEKEWGRLASKARTGRQIGAGFSFALAAAGVISGIVVLSLDSIDDETKSWLAPTLLVSGAATATAGVATLLIESQTETSYEAFLATRGKAPLGESSRGPVVRVSAAPTPHGGFIGVTANF